MPTEPDPTGATQPRAVKAPPPPVEFTGVVTSRRSSVLSAQIQAPIEKLHIHPGQLIRAGELVAVLSKVELETKLLQAQGQEQAAQMEANSFGAEASAAHINAVAEQNLFKRGVSSQVAVGNSRATYLKSSANIGAALGRLATAKAAREQCEKDLIKAEITAPLGGIVTNIKAHEGEVAQIGTPLARVFDPTDLIIRFAVPREHRNRLAPGQRVELTVEGNPRTVWATVTNISGAQEPPINFTVAEADIDDTKLAPGELTVASVGRVRLADARGAKP
jgi:multidrug efflux pump subunit AcrA (membrane-fusion protein)